MGIADSSLCVTILFTGFPTQYSCPVQNDGGW